MPLYFWFIVLLVKIFIAWKLPFFADEAYYWVWSHHHELSYFDHPPFVAWLLSLGHWLEPYAHLVRLPATLFGHLGLVAWYFLIRPFLTTSQLHLWFLLCLFSPITGFGMIIATPDTPLFLFWPVAMICFLKALESQSLTWYVFFGISLGLGFCSKYHMALLPILTILYLTFEKKWRLVRWQGVCLSTLFGFLFSLPVLYWNYKNDWASFQFQLTRGLGQSFKPMWVFDYIGSQILLIFPTILFFATKARLEARSRWMIYLGWGLPLFFLFSSFKGRVEPNWTSVSLPVLMAMAILAVPNIKVIKATLGIWIFALIVVGTELVSPWLPIEEKRLKTYEFKAYDAYISWTQEFEPVFASSYQMASTLSYKTKKQIYKLRGTHRPDHYDLMSQSQPTSETFYVIMGIWNKHPEWLDEYVMTEIYGDVRGDDVRLLKFTKKK